MTDASRFADTRVLITGASGFIGRHLCRRLSRMGAEVHAIWRTTQPSRDHDLHWWQGDLCDLSTVHHLLASIQPEVVFHLASHVAGGRDLAMVLPTFQSNLVSTVNLLTATATIGCRRLVLAGSLEESLASDIEAVPCSPYAAAKMASSAYARMFHALYELPVVIARLFMVYGPGQRDLRKLIPYVILSLLKEQVPKLTSGQRPVDWIYVDDVIDGLIAMAQAPNVEGCTIDMGSGVLCTVRAVVEQLVKVVGAHSTPFFGGLSDRPLEIVRAADTREAYAKLGWKATTSLESGLKQTVAWYRKSLEEASPGRAQA